MSYDVRFTRHALEQARERFGMNPATLRQCWAAVRPLTASEYALWEKNRQARGQRKIGRRRDRRKRGRSVIVQYYEESDVVFVLVRQDAVWRVVTVYPLYGHEIADVLSEERCSELVGELRGLALDVRTRRSWDKTLLVTVTGPRGKIQLTTSKQTQNGQVSLLSSDWRTRLADILPERRDDAVSSINFRLAVAQHKQHVSDFIDRVICRLFERLLSHGTRKTMAVSRLYFVVSGLRKRAANHDNDKLLEPELSGFLAAGGQLPVYGSAAYHDTLASLQATLAVHYAQNRHHPEHYANGVNGMHLVDVLEMLCDWWASSLTNGGSSIEEGVAHNVTRFGLTQRMADLLLGTVEELRTDLQRDSLLPLLVAAITNNKTELLHETDTQVSAVAQNTQYALQQAGFDD